MLIDTHNLFADADMDVAVAHFICGMSQDKIEHLQARKRLPRYSWNWLHASQISYDLDRLDEGWLRRFLDHVARFVPDGAIEDRRWDRVARAITLPQFVCEGALATISPTHLDKVRNVLPVHLLSLTKT